MEKVKSRYQSCAFCVRRSECWKSEAYSDGGEGGKKPYPSDYRFKTRFKFDKSIGGY